MTALVFVDANVFVHAREAGDAVKRAQARDWLQMLWREYRGRTSIQVLDEYYSTLTRKTRVHATREVAWSDVRELLKWKPQPLDEEVLTRAHEFESRFRLSWWACSILAAAQAQNCVLVLSEDLQDGADYDGVIVRSPFTLRIADEAGAYTVTPRLPSRHRGRGRPRRGPARTSAAS